MRRLATGLFLTLCALFAAAPRTAHAQQLLIDYVGFDYEDPNPDPSGFGELNSGYVGIGEVPNIFAPLVADPTNNYYTYYVSGATAIARQDFGDFVIVDYGTGTLSVFEDSKTSGTLAVYGTNPPNATAPSTFTDGTMILQGTLTNFRVVFSTFSNAGSYEGNLDVNGGSQLSLIPEDQRQGWTFSGFTGNATSIAPGYVHQVDGQVFLQEPTPAKPASWGMIKARYR
jgi:hypothetical protein